jgi:hypothetical protein
MPLLGYPEGPIRHYDGARMGYLTLATKKRIWGDCGVLDGRIMRRRQYRGIDISERRDRARAGEVGLLSHTDASPRNSFLKCVINSIAYENSITGYFPSSHPKYLLAKRF